MIIFGAFRKRSCRFRARSRRSARCVCAARSRRLSGGEIYEALDELSRLILPVDGAPWPAEATQAEDDDGEGEISDDRQ